MALFELNLSAWNDKLITKIYAYTSKVYHMFKALLWIFVETVCVHKKICCCFSSYCGTFRTFYHRAWNGQFCEKKNNNNSTWIFEQPLHYIKCICHDNVYILLTFLHESVYHSSPFSLSLCVFYFLCVNSFSLMPKWTDLFELNCFKRTPIVFVIFRKI